MTGPKRPSQTKDVDAGLGLHSSRQTASLTVAADSAVVSERKAGYKQDAYSEGIAFISMLVALALSFVPVFPGMANVSTVTPAVTTQFKALTTDVGWCASAYQLTIAVCTPLTSKIFTYFHIQWPSLVSFLIFGIGSALSGAAASLDMFIVGRAIACIGSAGLPIGMITIHKRPAKSRAIMGLGQLGVAGGPPICGALTSNSLGRLCSYPHLCLFPVITVPFLVNMIPEAHLKPHRWSVFPVNHNRCDLRCLSKDD